MTGVSRFPPPTDPSAVPVSSPSTSPIYPYATEHMEPTAPPAPPAPPGVEPFPQQMPYSPPRPQPPAQPQAQEPKKPDPVASPQGARAGAQTDTGTAYHAPTPSNLGHKPVVLVCSQCNHRGPSVVTSDNCTAINWICTLVFCLCCFFCIPATAKHTHTCSKCGGYLGSNNVT